MAARRARQQQAQQDGGDEDTDGLATLPAHLQDAPELWVENVDAWHAFTVLSGSRAIGMGVGPIPLSEYRALFGLLGTSPDWTLIRKVQAVDQVFMEHQADRQRQQQQTANHGPGRAGSGHRTPRAQRRPFRGGNRH